MDNVFRYSNELFGRFDGQEADDKSVDTQDDIIELLGEDDGKEEIKDEIKDDKGKDDKDVKDEDKKDDDALDEEEEDEDKLEIEDEDEDKIDEKKLDLIVPPRKKEILKKYPKLFEDFPALEASYFRDKQFTELFATPKDAEAALEDSNILHKFETDLGKGHIAGVLETVKKSDPKAFDRLVDNYLQAIATVDKDAYLEIAGNVIKGITSKMLSNSDDDIKLAAKLVNKFAFGTDEPGESFRRTKQESKEDDSVKKEREEYDKERFNDAKTDFDSRVENTLKNTILANIDKKEEMTEYVKRNATKDALSNLKSLIEQDKSFARSLDTLWKKAREERYSRSSLDRIKSAYLSKAKTILVPVITKARGEALKGLGKTRVEKDRKGQVRRNSGPDRKPDNNGRDDVKKEKGIPRGMTTEEWLNLD